MVNRDNILDEFIVAEDMSHAVLKDYLRRYPEYTKDLLALFNELMMNDLDVAEVSPPVETMATIEETSRVRHVQQTLFGDGVKELARELGLPRSFFLGLNTNVVHLGSMPIEFLKNLAARLDVRLQDLISGMQLRDNRAVAMKSDIKPGGNPPVEFWDYVAQVGLDEEERRSLQKLHPNHGSD